MGNVNKQEEKVEYINHYFTIEGEKAVSNFLNTLLEIYFTKDVYPNKLGFIVGIPNFQSLNIISSKDELKGRIKAYMQILGIEKLKIERHGNVYEMVI